MPLSVLLQDLRDALGASGAEVSVLGPQGRTISGVSHDSRAVPVGGMFVALPGRHHDGHQWVSGLAQVGAVVVEREVVVPPGCTLIRVPSTRRILPALAASFYGHPGRVLPVAGVTGTNGKTTITWMAEAALQAHGWRVGVVGTTGHRVAGQVVREQDLCGVPSPHHTTPEATLYQALLARMVAERCAAALVEVSSIGLESFRADAVPYRVAAFTNLTRDHLDIHGTMAVYRAAKARLFHELLAPDGRAILNLDDPAHDSMRPPHQEVWTYGLNAGDLRLEQITMTPQGSRARIHTPAGAGWLVLGLPGRHNLSNALAAVGIALSLGVPLPVALAGLARLAFVPGRVQTVDSGRGYAIFIDYAHTPDALETVLSGLREAVSGRLITVFGCGGERDRGKRPEMGAIASRMSDVSLVTSDNPRGEDPALIIADILTGVDPTLLHGPEPRVLVEPDREAAIERALALARPGDAVLLAGKGHEATQDRGGQCVRFDDREVAERLRGALGMPGGEET